MSRPGVVARLLLALVTGYRRWVTPLLPARCRFSPTCSAYAAEALARHGALRGGILSVRRVARCHPFHTGGHDPVPPVGPSSASMDAAPAARTPVVGALPSTSARLGATP